MASSLQLSLKRSEKTTFLQSAIFSPYLSTSWRTCLSWYRHGCCKCGNYQQDSFPMFGESCSLFSWETCKYQKSLSDLTGASDWEQANITFLSNLNIWWSTWDENGHVENSMIDDLWVYPGFSWRPDAADYMKRQGAEQEIPFLQLVLRPMVLFLALISA